MIIAGFFGCKIVHNPEEADFIVDDIIDSGKTKKRFKKLFLRRNLYHYLKKIKK